MSGRFLVHLASTSTANLFRTC